MKSSHLATLPATLDLRLRRSRKCAVSADHRRSCELGRKIVYVRADFDAWLAIASRAHTSEGDKLPRRLTDDLGARRLAPIAQINSLLNEGGQ